MNALEVKANIVVCHLETGKKMVVFEQRVAEVRINAEEYEYICEQPHADEDFSYCCGFQWCRCMQ